VASTLTITPPKVTKAFINHHSISNTKLPHNQYKVYQTRFSLLFQIVVSLRQLERQTAREKDRMTEHLSTVEQHYTRQIEGLQLSWWSVLLVEETRVSEKKHQPTCRKSLTNHFIPS
jgi:hypothetical protein